MNHDEIVKHMDARFDRVESKLDKHLEQISTNTEAIGWIKGHVKLSMTMIITIIGVALTAYFGG